VLSVKVPGRSAADQGQIGVQRCAAWSGHCQPLPHDYRRAPERRKIIVGKIIEAARAREAARKARDMTAQGRTRRRLACSGQLTGKKTGEVNLPGRGRLAGGSAKQGRRNFRRFAAAGQDSER
jgi:DNA gyrase/topoisomerase IV subunit B